MSYLREVDLEATFPAFVSIQKRFGFLPNLFRAQTLRPGILEAEAGLVDCMLARDTALSRIRKESISLAVAVAHHDLYSVTWHYYRLRSLGMPDYQLDQIVTGRHGAGRSKSDAALLEFALKLATHPLCISAKDVTLLRDHEFSDESILEAILMTALTYFFCTLSAGLGPSFDFEPPAIPEATSTPPPEARSHAGDSPRPYLRVVELSSEEFPPLIMERFRFIPKLFRAQTIRRDLIEAETCAFRDILQPEDALSREQKECILLVASAANLNTYCVAAHCEVLRLMGMSMEESDQIAVDHHQADLPPADKKLLDFVLKLTVRASEVRQADIDRLRHDNFTDEQLLETVVVTALNNFFNTLQMGLGTTPDIKPMRTFGPNDARLPPSFDRVKECAQVDPDLELVSKVQKGDLDAFEVLITRHSRRIYRTLMGIVTNVEDAEDAVQDTFLKAFRYIGNFQRRSHFSTWLVSIAINTGVQRLRDRRSLESFDDVSDTDDEGFRPRQVRAWGDPEQLCSQSERRRIVEKELMKLPFKYRVVLMLRDIEQFSTDEAAAALGLGVPALKARLLRGRLMLREALSPHFGIGTKRMAS